MSGQKPSDRKTALVLGANGQDGTYLVQHLLSRGYSVLGAGRNQTATPVLNANYRYQGLDLRNQAAFGTFLKAADPDLVFHAAAVHASAAGSSATMYEENFDAMLAVNTASVHTTLEYFRANKSSGKLVYISSGKMFGPDYPAVVSEDAPQFRKCLYTITKGAAGDVISYYRNRHNVRASILFPFAHESAFRPADFFISKLVQALAAALRGEKSRTPFMTLEFSADWGDAEEYMDIAVDIAERCIGEDFILGRGRTWYARDLVQRVFSAFALNYRDYLDVPELAAEHSSFSVSNQKLLSALGRVPQYDIADAIVARATAAKG